MFVIRERLYAQVPLMVLEEQHNNRSRVLSTTLRTQTQLDTVNTYIANIRNK